MFQECEDFDIEDYADVTAPYTCTTDADAVTSKLQSRSDKLFTLFKNNHMKVNSENVNSCKV